MKAIIALALILSAAVASADQFKTVSKDLSSEKYQSSIEYPQLLKTSVPAYKKINQELVRALTNDGCDAQEAAESDYGYDYSAIVRIVGLNKSYVGYEVSTSSYCGGAHPNYYVYHMTFDAQTGSLLEMNQEIAVQDFGSENLDWEIFEKYQSELAEIIYQNLDSADLAYTDLETIQNCIAINDGKEAAIEQIKILFPMISGLAKDKKVIINTSPAHVAAVCQFSVRVPFSEVEKYFKKSGQVAKWLK